MCKSAEKLKKFGHNNIKWRVGLCGYCDQPLREKPLRCADLLCCDACGRIWQYGTEGLLCEIGRREVS